MEPARGSSPFRSLGEQVRERIRRIDEETQAVATENARLLADVARSRRRGRPSNWLLALGVTVTAAGCGAGSLYADERAATHVAERARGLEVAMETERAAEQECAKKRSEAIAMLLSCKGEPWMSPLPPATTRVVVDCSPGDPLCIRTLPPFSREEAAAALSKIEQQAGHCLAPFRAVQVHAAITVGPDGVVTSAHLDQWADLTPIERACVTTKLRTMRVPRFEGRPISIGRTFSWGPA
ncbi:MAG: hypothetical protein JST00_32705 [Deltaproteobacteria bacterium]|nr:hypothetical protein [Deltaproteobacteria bacterium]